MSAVKEKKFVMKHVFFNAVHRSESIGKTEEHFGFNWSTRITRNSTYVNFYLKCVKPIGEDEWSIDTVIDIKKDEKSGQVTVSTVECSFSERDSSEKSLGSKCSTKFVKYLVDGNVPVEFEVKIRKMFGPKQKKMRIFDDQSAKSFSDVVLVAGDQKFHVLKQYLSLHSTYFKSLLFGEFEESRKSKIELKDIDAEDLQKFLEVVYGEPAVVEDTVEGILKLADMYDSKTGIDRCEEFYLNKSKQTLRKKFHVAIEYKINELKKKCMSEMKTAAEYHSILPENSSDFSSDLWKELYLKGIGALESSETSIRKASRSSGRLLY